MGLDMAGKVAVVTDGSDGIGTGKFHGSEATRVLIAARRVLGASVVGLAAVWGAWCRYRPGAREDGSMVAPKDPTWHEVTERALAATDKPRPWLQLSALYRVLGQIPPPADAFANWPEIFRQQRTDAAPDCYAAYWPQ